MNKILQSLSIVLLLLLSNACLAALTPQEQAVKKAYEGWCNAIGTAKGDPKVVVAYYAPNAILLPTLSGKMLKNENGGLDDYFKKLTSLPNTKCKTDKEIIHMHGDLATNSGFYTFSYTDKNGKTKEIPARYTFVYKKTGDQWLIIKHHSSKTPEG